VDVELVIDNSGRCVALVIELIDLQNSQSPAAFITETIPVSLTKDFMVGGDRRGKIFIQGTFQSVMLAIHRRGFERDQ
jgi:hypothetical protein